MRSILVRTAFAAFAILSAVAVPAAPKDGKAPADLQKRVTELEAAFNARDAKKFGALFTPDGSFINPLGERATGRGEVVSRIAEDFEGPLQEAKSQIRIETVRMLSPTLALLDLEQELTGVKLPAPAPEPARAHSVAIMQKTAGKWMVVALRPYFFLPPHHGSGGDAQRGAAGEPARGESAPNEPAQRGSQEGGSAPSQR